MQITHFLADNEDHPQTQLHACSIVRNKFDMMILPVNTNCMVTSKNRIRQNISRTNYDIQLFRCRLTSKLKK